MNTEESSPDYYVVTDSDFAVYSDGTVSPYVTVLYDGDREYFAPAICYCGRHNPCRRHIDVHLVNKHHNYD